MLTRVPGGGYVCWEVEKASVAKQSRPQLNADDSEYEEDEKAKHENIAEHRQRVEQQRHQDTHACRSRTTFAVHSVGHGSGP